MSQCSFCENKSGLKCPLSPDLSRADHFLVDVPLHGQVFGLPPPSKHPPFLRRKLTDRELREGIEKYDLWLHVPFWQVPRVSSWSGATSRQLFIRSSVSMKKILRMAKRNETLDGYIGRLNFTFPHFGKRRPKRSPEETGEASIDPKINLKKTYNPK